MRRRAFQSSGYQVLMANVHKYERLLETLSQDEEKKGRSIVSGAHEALDYHIFRPRYDEAWAEVLNLRSFLCEHLLLSTLIGSIFDDVGADIINYLRDKEREKALQELHRLRHEALKLLEKPDGVKEPILRTRFQSVCTHTAEARLQHWAIMNTTRRRLEYTGYSLIALLPFYVLILPVVIHEKKSHNFYLGILFFGALGGLISALGRRESLGNLSEFYLGRLSLFLRPFLGSALAGVVYLAVQGGLFSFLAIKSESPRPALLVLSFLAGFLERAVVEHLLWPGGPDLSEKGVTYA